MSDEEVKVRDELVSAIGSARKLVAAFNMDTQLFNDSLDKDLLEMPALAELPPGYVAFEEIYTALSPQQVKAVVTFLCGLVYLFGGIPEGIEEEAAQ